MPSLRFPEFQPIPAWPVQPLGDFFTERQEAGFTTLPLLSVTDKDGVIPQEDTNRRNNSNTDKAKYLRVVPGDIAYNTMRMWEGRSALVGIEGIVSPAYTVCAPIKDVHSPFFAYYFKTSSLIAEFRRYSQGLVEDTLNLKYEAFRNIPVGYPSPAEQQKIADCLTSLDAVIAAQGQKVEALKAHKKGLMQHLFPQEGQTVPSLRFPEFRDGPEWENSPLGELTTIVRGGSPRPIDGYMTNDDDGLNWLKIGDVDKEAKYVTRTAEKVRSEALSKTRVIRPGDFILSNSMSFGRPYISKIETCIHDGWIAVTEVPDDLAREFLYYSIASDPSQSFFSTRAAGGGVQNLNTEIVKSLPVIHPSKDEQQRIADCLASLDTALAAASAVLAALKTHKKGLMQGLFPVMEKD